MVDVNESEKRNGFSHPEKEKEPGLYSMLFFIG